MNTLDTSRQLIYSKAMYRPAESPSPARPRPTAPPPADANPAKLTQEPDHTARLEDLVPQGTKASSQSLRDMIRMADDVLTKQNRMIDDMNSILNLGRAEKAYKAME
jgi:3-oxoacyl-ACP reductase-like protein